MRSFKGFWKIILDTTLAFIIIFLVVYKVFKGIDNFKKILQPPENTRTFIKIVLVVLEASDSFRKILEASGRY